MVNRAVFQGVKRILYLQMSVVAALFFTLWVLTDHFVAYSALLGGMTCVLPNWLFARVAFRYFGARSAWQIVWSFYWGEILKLIFAATLFILVFKTIKISGAAFFCAFFVVQIVFWFAPWLLTLRKTTLETRSSHRKE